MDGMKNMAIEVLPAGNGKEALQLLETINPSMVFIDVNIPEMDGYNWILERFLAILFYTMVYLYP